MSEKKTFRTGKGKLISVRECHRIWPTRRRESLDQGFLEARLTRLPSAVKALAVLAAVAIPLTGVQPSASAPVASAAEQFGLAATTAFQDSAAGLDTSLTSKQRSAGLPVNPAAGLVSQSPVGAVEMVLPANLGSGQLTSAGQMVYPDAGAGFDLLAENTRDGYRTVARINEPSGARSVSTFVRTPADTVMLMHSSGHLTLNRATPQAETLGVMSPAEARDSGGNIVYSAYVAKQVAPQLYQVSEVISPTDTTAWPVYVDPPLAVGDGYSQFGWSDVGDTVGGAVSAVGNGFKKAGDFLGSAMAAQADGNALQAQAVSQTVQEHPTQSAMLIGGAALMATGVGSAPGASLLTEAALAVNNTSIAVEAIASTDPNNKGLQNFSAGMQIVAALTPQGLTKKTIGNVAENAVEQGLKKGTDDIASEAATVTRVTPETATDPTKLSQEVAAAAKTPEVPKAPNAPPSTSLPACSHMDCGHVNENPSLVYNAGTMPEHFDHKLDAIEKGQPSTLTRGNPIDTSGRRRDALGGIPTQTGKARDEYPFASTAEGGEGSSVRYVPRDESNREGPLIGGFYKKNQVGEGDRFNLAFRGDDGRVRCATCAIDQRAADRQIAARPSPQSPSKLPARPSSPAEQRQVQQAGAEQASQAQRSKALQGARTVNSVAQQQSQHNSEPQTVHARPESEAQQRDNQAVRNNSVTSQTRDHARDGARPNTQNTASTHNGNGSSHDSGSHSKNSGSKKNNKGNGKGNRAKRSRTGRH
ncbi:NucA/NucB deoxyribonuclease domain-containing protein [Mycobacteroides sp. LB1]|uniref:NucA/NucB deoxyribonuclease domain-containing protein n=1 Tax=Mycobacteroides sp. LB1 TaxID=2750814 RepID=UPI0015DD7E23|nr:hypothetical protein [Mycobacteroides sp. LB1]